MKTTREKAEALPPDSRVSVTASPDKGMGATVDLSVHLARAGHRVTPHLSARLTKSKAELEGIVRSLDKAGIHTAFVVAGDADDPGDFFDALELLNGLEAVGHPFSQIGITGYPEGHPFISDEALAEALLVKAPSAAYLATQLCFDPSRIASWIRSIRDLNVGLPVFVGVPGVVDTMRLMTIGARIGVGQSLRYLSKNRKSVARMLRPGASSPHEIVAGLVADADELGIAGVHVFTFNAVAETVEWLENTELR